MHAYAHDSQAMESRRAAESLFGSDEEGAYTLLPRVACLRIYLGILDVLVRPYACNSKPFKRRNGIVPSQLLNTELAALVARRDSSIMSEAPIIEAPFQVDNLQVQH